MEARNRWEFAGPDGEDLPAAHFSRHVMKWKQWYNLPLETLVQEANQAARSDFYGLITSFEPGFADTRKHFGLERGPVRIFVSAEQGTLFAG